MEGDLIYTLAFMGGFSLYLVIATAIGRSIYSRLSGLKEDGRIVFSIFGGGLFPITLPLIVIALWINAMINIPCSKEKRNSNNGKNYEEYEEEDDTDYSESPFKVGDLVTGVEGNPGNYKKLYEGCVCRVLETDKGDEDMRVILVDHIDKEAQNRYIGDTHIVPWENFTLIKPKKVIKRAIKKKVVTKKKR